MPYGMLRSAASPGSVGFGRPALVEWPPRTKPGAGRPLLSHKRPANLRAFFWLTAIPREARACAGRGARAPGYGRSRPFPLGSRNGFVLALGYSALCAGLCRHGARAPGYGHSLPFPRGCGNGLDFTFSYSAGGAEGVQPLMALISRKSSRPHLPPSRPLPDIL